MRALMLGWEFPPHISGGLGTACHGIARGLARHGVEVTFLLPRAMGDEDRGPTRILGTDDIPEDAAPEDAPAGGAGGARVVPIDSALLPYLSPEEYARRAAALVERDRPAAAVAASPPEVPDAARRVEVAGRPPGAAGRYGEDLFSEVARYASAVARLARRERFDVVHAHDWMTFPAGIAAKAASGRPLVVHVHAIEHDRAGAAGNPAIEAIEREGLEAADRVICVSHYTAGLVRARYGTDPGKIRVVHNAVTRREQRESWRVEKPYANPVVLFVGRVTYQKGPVYFLEAAARVARVRRDARFVICGSGDMLPSVVERAAAMGLARQVRFTGFLSGPEVERAFAMADVYVMPSVSEPFGIAPLEAMAGDVPVIVSRQSGVAEVVRGALKVDYWDVEDLANKILAVLRHPALRASLVAEAREDLKEMRWEARAALVRAVYDEVA